MYIDKNLFDLIKQSNEQAFEVLFRLYYEPLVNYSLKYTKDTDLSQGLIQDLFVRLWEKRKQLPSQSPASYLYQSAKNACLNYLRHQKVRDTYAEHELHNEQFEETQLLEDHEILSQVYKSINKLPEQCRRIFIMSRMHGLRHKEIAEDLGIAVKTVKNQVGKALKILQNDFPNINIGLIILLLEVFSK